MRLQRLEARVLEHVDTVVNGARVEDDRVDLKASFPSDHRKGARQIAGIANAAGGETVLWIVGVDEDGHRVVDRSADVDPAAWWAQVERWFAEVAPDIRILTVPTPHGSVVALEVETSRAPYLVTTDGRSGVDREVPWRSATGTRSAHRSEILRSLVGEVAVPALELVVADLRVDWINPAVHGNTGDSPDASPYVRGHLDADVYVEATTSARLPEHRWQLVAEVGGREVDLSMRMWGPTVPSHSNESSWGWQEPRQHMPAGSISYVRESGLHVDGSDRIHLRGYIRQDDPDGVFGATFRAARKLNVRLTLPLANSARAARLDFALRRVRLREQERSSSLRRSELLDARLGEFVSGGLNEYRDYYPGEEQRRTPSTKS